MCSRRPPRPCSSSQLAEGRVSGRGEHPLHGASRTARYQCLRGAWHRPTGAARADLSLAERAT
eukprot:2265996-Alexandrium_andersonii.AAC.1